MHRLELTKRWSPLRALVVLGFCIFAVVGWFGVTTVSRFGGVDSGEHLLYAEYLDQHGRLPSETQNYEYSSPPLYQATAVVAERTVDALPSIAVELSSNPVTRAVWLLLVAAGVFALTTSRRRVRMAGLAALGLAGLVAVDEAISLGRSEPWSAGRLLALAGGAGLIFVTGLIAREVWPAHVGRAVAAGAFAAAYPVVYRMSVLFHPEAPFAFLCALAVLLLLRASSRSWPARRGWWFGLVCGLAALTLQPAVLVIVVLAVAALWLGRGGAKGFLIRAALVTVLLAAPWWGYAYHRWHNPFQSNLDPRASLMMSRQPASFLFSFPIRSLIVHPYRPDFTDALFPKLHAELWSDWFGGIHRWPTTSRVAKVTASTQSVLGFFADALAIWGLAALAVPALVRILRRRGRAPTDDGLAVLALLAITAFAAFTIMLLRFPQQYDDPIKSSYLLFTAPCWAVFSVAAWSSIRRRWLNGILVVVAALYVVSYGADLSDALNQPSGPPPVVSGFLDLSVGVQQTSPNAPRGNEVDFLTSVLNSGNEPVGDLVLTLSLSPGMHLLGYPHLVTGTGCRGLTKTVVCELDYLNPTASTYIRYAVEDSRPGAQTIKATASSALTDVNPANNTVTYRLTPSP